MAVLEEWQVLDDGKLVGKIKGDPKYTDGDIITTSPLINPSVATESSFVQSMTGSKYLLGSPSSSSRSNKNGSVLSRDDFLGDILTVSGLVGLTAFGFNLGSSSTSGGGSKSAWTKATPGQLVVEPKSTTGAVQGTTLSPQEVRDLFRLWNTALMTGNPDTVTRRYTKDAVLLPTKSDIPRTDYEGIRDYFVHFLEKKPVGKILESYGKSCSI